MSDLEAPAKRDNNSSLNVPTRQKEHLEAEIGPRYMFWGTLYIPRHTQRQALKKYYIQG